MVELPSASPFAGDDGSASPALLGALRAHAVGDADLYAVQAELLGSRLLTPIIARLDELEYDESGRVREKSAAMSTVTVQGRDGRMAVPVFTSVASLQAWNPGARPVPTAAVDAARGAYEQGAVALLVDPADSWTTVLLGPPLLALAEGRRWVPAAQDQAVLDTVREALQDLPGVSGLTMEAATEADLSITLHVAGDADSTRAVAQLAADRLAACELLRGRLSKGLDLAVAPA